MCDVIYELSLKDSKNCFFAMASSTKVEILLVISRCLQMWLCPRPRFSSKSTNLTSQTSLLELKSFSPSSNGTTLSSLAWRIMIGSRMFFRLEVESNSRFAWRSCKDNLQNLLGNVNVQILDFLEGASLAWTNNLTEYEAFDPRILVNAYRNQSFNYTSLDKIVKFRF